MLSRPLRHRQSPAHPAINAFRAGLLLCFQMLPSWFACNKPAAACSQQCSLQGPQRTCSWDSRLSAIMLARLEPARRACATLMRPPGRTPALSAPLLRPATCHAVRLLVSDSSFLCSQTEMVYGATGHDQQPTQCLRSACCCASKAPVVEDPDPQDSLR